MSVPANISLHVIPSGNAGILHTLMRMRAMVHSALASPWVAWAITQWPADAPAAQRIASTYEWTLRHLIYVNDGQAADSVPVEEEIRHPDYTLAQIASHGTAEGDCDDFVIVTGALLLAQGIPARMVVTSSRRDQEFDHVFLEAWTGTDWLTLDGIHGQPLGWSVFLLGTVTNVQRIDL